MEAEAGRKQAEVDWEMERRRREEAEERVDALEQQLAAMGAATAGAAAAAGGHGCWAAGQPPVRAEARSQPSPVTHVDGEVAALLMQDI